MKILLVVGMEMEAEAAVGSGRANIVVVIGAGNATALAAKIENAIADGDIDCVFVTGVAGALDPNLVVGDVEICRGVCNGPVTLPTDAAWTKRLWGALNGIDAPSFSVGHSRFACAPGTVASAADKAALYAATSASVVDEETGVAAAVAKAHGLRFAGMRVVSDPASLGRLPPAAMVKLNAGGGVDDAGIVASIASDPGQIPGLMQLAGYSKIALDNFGEALARIGDDFCAYE